MPYTINPHLPRVRMQAVLLVRKGWSIRKVARYLGFHHTAVMRWLKKAPADGRKTIPTQSSRPHHHPQALPRSLVERIIAQRLVNRRCAEVVHEELRYQGIIVSLSSVKRTLKRASLLNERSPWKRYHAPMERPVAAFPGALVQIDTIHIMTNKKERFYLYTLIDVYSRFAYAKTSEKINTWESIKFTQEAQIYAPFVFATIQTDHGQEFSSCFTQGLKHKSRTGVPSLLQYQTTSLRN